MKELAMILAEMAMTKNDDDVVMILNNIMSWENRLAEVSGELGDGPVSFGEYLLSDDRRELLEQTGSDPSKVYHADIENWLEKE